MSSQLELEDAIWRWVDSNTPPNVTVIWSRFNTMRPGESPCAPGEPYVTLQFTAISNKLGQDSIIYQQNDDFLIGGQRTATLSIIAYGPQKRDVASGQSLGAFDILKNLRNSLDYPEVYEALRRDGLAVFNEPSITDISTLLETGFQDRSNMDIVFGFAQNQVVPVGTIESIAGESVFIGSDSHEQDFEIN